MEYIQGLIEQRKGHLEESQQQKEVALDMRAGVQESLYETIVSIQQLSMLEYDIIESLIKTEHSVDMVAKRISLLKSLYREQLARFYVNYVSGEHNIIEQIENIYFPEMIKLTENELLQKIDILSGFEQQLLHSRDERDQIQRIIEQQEHSGGLIRMEIEKLHTIIDSLNSEELAYLDELHNLERNRLAVESLIEMLQSDEHTFSYKFTRDKFDPPVKGEIVSFFGEVRDEDSRLVLINNGIDIVSGEMQVVTAIDFGVVVFAEQFRNYGRLVIIDHLNGYFSLYANNSSLLVAKGDTVKLGEPIARMGQVPGEDKYLLHFELRRHNKAVDPLLYMEE